MVGEFNQTFVLPEIVPRCYSPEKFDVVEIPGLRVRRLLATPFAPEGPALLEAELPGSPEAPMAVRVRCGESSLSVRVSADTEGAVVLRERHHSGWRIHDESGKAYASFPVNQVHMGVRVPPGERTLTWRFVPPGVRWAQAALLVGLIVAAIGIGRGGLIPGLR